MSDGIRPFHIRSFTTGDPAWQRGLDAALAGLRGNVQPVPGAAEPLLIEGGKYRGAWLESGPADARAYAPIDPEPYLAVHRVFFTLQREDGQLPCFVRHAGIGWSQVQTVEPIAVTALDAGLQYGDDAFLRRAYDACARWDAWLVRHRDPRSLDLCEAFCEYDTGHDNSPRWRGLPKVCRDRDARHCPPDDPLPYLAPDLSASLYGGRLALATMADTIGRPREAADWRERAERTRAAMMRHLFDEETLCFYDRDRHGRFVRIVGDVLLRVLAEGIVDDDLFDRIFDRWVSNPDAFWTPFPMPSIAACDPQFPAAIPDNSWGGASQALTALRAPRWFERHGRFSELTHLMATWVRGLVEAGAFRQQADPFTGTFATTENYTPAMCVLLDHSLRLRGVARLGTDELSWGCWRPVGGNDAESACSFDCETGDGEIRSDGHASTLVWRGEPVARIEGSARVITGARGDLRRLVGIGDAHEHVALELPHGRRVELRLAPNQQVDAHALTAAAESARS